MAMKPLFKPGENVIADLNGMFVGKSIYIFGRIHDDADRFGINLLCGDSNNDDIALHINPRFGEGQVVRNTRSNGWGPEERSGASFPFSKGGLFGIKITCIKDYFEIDANEARPFATYRHRVPANSITHVSVSQQCDVILLTSGIEGLDVPAMVFPKPAMGRMEIPFYGAKGRKIQILGSPTNPHGGFSFNLVCEDGQICFHYNPRLNEQQIVRNTRSHGGWGQEERDLGFPFPFQAGVPFQTTLTVDDGAFKVEINGAQAFTYANRMQGRLDQVRYLEVTADVGIEKVTYF